MASARTRARRTLDGTRYQWFATVTNDGTVPIEIDEVEISTDGSPVGVGGKGVRVGVGATADVDVGDPTPTTGTNVVISRFLLHVAGRPECHN